LEVTISHYIILSSMLFMIGAFGVIARRNLIIVLMSLELMLNASNLSLVAFSRLHNENTGQVFMLMALVVAASEVAVGLALVVVIYNKKDSINIDILKLLKG
jgi:NADH-quinone oxidoreductase subunit K